MIEFFLKNNPHLLNIKLFEIFNTSLVCFTITYKVLRSFFQASNECILFYLERSMLKNMACMTIYLLCGNRLYITFYSSRNIYIKFTLPYILIELKDRLSLNSVNNIFTLCTYKFLKLTFFLLSRFVVHIFTKFFPFVNKFLHFIMIVFTYYW